MFPVTSRYYGIEIVKYELPDGREVVHLRRRFLPARASDTVIAEHVVVEGDRLDNIAARYLADAEQFWRVCDANNAMEPDELTAEIGRRLRISFPQSGAI